MTPFSLLIQACGLSLQEAANFLNVRKDTVASWATGRRQAGDDVIGTLKDLYEQQIERAAGAVEFIAAKSGGHEIEVGYPSDDHEAQALGFPCVGAWRTMAAMVIAKLDQPVKLVPRGSTPGTAAAADAHGK